LVVAGTCVDLLTDRGISTKGNVVKEGRIEREIFLGVKIVNAGTCDEDVVVEIVNTGVCDGKGDPAGGGRSNHGIRGKREPRKVWFRGTA
jgi:hypothetical protein